ncbi:helix-turn-helix domain-containing protein [Paenibacillus polymyxa]|uniref:helix-turn-helix domain-containing protein n=1 Tax=Paenibacillus polymyxa TaxID=1406 RepID=UPI00307DB133
MSEYLGVQAFAEELGFSTATIYKLINHKDESQRLEPVNRLTHRGDGGYKFAIEYVEKIKTQLVKKDLRVSDVARILNRSKAYVHQLLKSGQITYYEGYYQGHKTFFIKKEDLDKYISKMGMSKNKTLLIYDKEREIFLFQPYYLNGELARVMEIQKNHQGKTKVELRTRQEVFSYEEATNAGWKPGVKIISRKPIGTYGNAVFEFPKPIDLDSSIYRIIEEFFKAAGPKNLKITLSDEKIKVLVKRIVIKEGLHPDLLDRMRNGIQSGEIDLTNEGLLISPGYSTIHVPDKLRQKLVEAANQSGVSLEDYLELFCLPEKLN